MKFSTLVPNTENKFGTLFSINLGLLLEKWINMALKTTIQSLINSLLNVTSFHFGQNDRHEISFQVTFSQKLTYYMC